MRLRIAIAACIAGLAQQATAAPLQPTSTWFVDYDDAQCVATRNYGTDEKPLLFVMKPSPFGGVMRILIISQGYYSTADQMIARVQFDDRPNIKTKALRYSDDERKLKIQSINLPMNSFRAQEGAKSIAISVSGTDHSFALSDVPTVLGELEKCRLNLLEVWNANRPERVRQGAMPIKPLNKVYSSLDYPRSSFGVQDQGTVAIVLLIDESGRVSDCSVDATAGAATLDTMSCYVIQKRAKFRPAIGIDGKPTKSVYTQRITWRIGL